MHCSIWVSSQTPSAWRHSVFLIQNDKEPVFIIGYERQEKRWHYKAFQQT